MAQLKQPTKHVEPPDGGYGWVIVFALFIVFAVIGGMVNSCGILLVAFREYFDERTQAVAWIGSIWMALLCMSGPAAGKLTDLYGTRVIVVFGALLSTIGMISSIWATSVFILYITFGLIVGIGHGLVVVSAIPLLAKYFKRRHAFANGISFSGAGIGMLCFSPFLNFLIDFYGWRGSLFIMAGINVQLFVCAALLRPLESNKPGTYKGSQNLTEKIQISMETYTSKTVKGFNETYDGRKTTDLQKIDYKLLDTEITHDGVQISTQRTEKQLNRCDKLLTKLGVYMFVENLGFTMICIGQFLEGIGSTVIMTLLFARIVHAGVDKSDAAFLLTNYGCFSLLARVSHGVIVDRKVLSATRLLGLAIGTLGVAVTTSPITNEYVILMIFAAIFGIANGTIHPLVPVCIRECVGDEHMGVAFGWDYFFMGIGTLVGPPFAGWLVDITGNYDAAFYVIGGMLICSGILMVLSPLVGARKRGTSEDILCKSDTKDKCDAA